MKFAFRHFGVRKHKGFDTIGYVDQVIDVPVFSFFVTA